MQKRGRGGRPPKLGAKELRALRGIVEASPHSTIAELQRLLLEATGVSTSNVTLYKGLRRAGIRRELPSKAKQRVVVREPRSYGYRSRHRDPGDEARYASSLTDHEWSLVADLFETEGGRGRPSKYPRRCILNACCYVVRTGCSWRMLPKDFPPWDDVYKTFRRWSESGRFEQMHDRLRAAWRKREERDEAPSAAVIDAQSVKHSHQGGDAGYDAGKKVKGRKRHLIVDTLGLLLAVAVTPASVQDRDAAPKLVERTQAKYATVKTLFADSGYAGRVAGEIEQRYGVRVEIVRRPPPQGRWKTRQLDLLPVPETRFVVLPKRWVVERTHSWNEKSRRLSRDYDRRIDVSCSWIWLAEARLLAKRLSHG